MADSVTCRQHAEECLRLADIVASPPDRAALLIMAEAWHRLAQDKERAEEGAALVGNARAPIRR
jgi:hypothetical protein